MPLSNKPRDAAGQRPRLRDITLRSPVAFHVARRLPPSSFRGLPSSNLRNPCDGQEEHLRRLRFSVLLVTGRINFRVLKSR